MSKYTLHTSIRVITVTSVLFCIALTVNYAFLTVKHKHLLVEKNKRAFTMVDHNQYRHPPANYHKYMTLWMFQKLECRPKLISEISKGGSQILLFELDNVIDPGKIQSVPFGKMEIDGMKLTWSFVRSKNSGLHEDLESYAIVKLQYLLVGSTGFRAIVNGIESTFKCNTSKEWQALKKDGFYILPKEIQVNNSIFICGVSKSEALIRVKTINENSQYKIKCDREIKIDY